MSIRGNVMGYRFVFYTVGVGVIQVATCMRMYFVLHAHNISQNVQFMVFLQWLR